jgi:hypothetical protein
MANYRHAARKAARRYGLNPNIFERQINQESGFNPRAVSPAGARGIAQIMPATARSWGVNPDHPRQALDAAARNMANYVRQYGSYRNALIAYNAGPGAVGRGSLPSETQNYIRTILGGGGGGGGRGSASLALPRARRQPRTVTTGSVTLGSPDRLQLIDKTSFDKAGFEQARRRSIVGQMLARSHGTNSVLFRSGVLSTQAPNPADFTTQTQDSRIVPGRDPSLTFTSRTIGGGGGGAADMVGAPSSGQLHAAIKRANHTLGIREVGTSNRGRQVDKIERTFGMIGQPWCGLWLGQTLKKAGVRGVNSGIASVATIEADARAHRGPFRGFVSARHARPGDALITVKGQHVVLVVARHGHRIETIGGNSGGAVQRVTYDDRQVHGAARVRYR